MHAHIHTQWKKKKMWKESLLGIWKEYHRQSSGPQQGSPQGSGEPVLIGESGQVFGVLLQAESLECWVCVSRGQRTPLHLTIQTLTYLLCFSIRVLLCCTDWLLTSGFDPSALESWQRWCYRHTPVSSFGNFFVRC